jgi:hypothetical protein
MKKITAVLIGILLFIPLAMAFEFDNVHTYDPVTGIVTITNAFGLGDDLFIGKLGTPHTVSVFPGEDRLVAQVDVIYIKKQGTAIGQFFNGMQFRNLHANNNTFNRDFDWYINDTESYQLKHTNSSNCVPIGINSQTCDNVDWYETKYKTIWRNITGIGNLPDGNFSIGLHTDVKKGDYVDWIPNLFGVDIDEWAFWQDSYGYYLESYYGLNGTTGAVRDNLGNHEGTISGAVTRGHMGIDSLERANNSFKGGDNGASVNLSNPNLAPCFSDYNCTISYWVNNSVSGSEYHYTEIVDQKTNANYINIAQRFSNIGSIYVNIRSNAPANQIIETAGGYLTGENANRWHHVVVVMNVSSVTIYVNGTERADEAWRKCLYWIYG